MLSYIATTFLILTGLFMIFIILLQRGRGGGLAGAFGGLGGQSAFGTKAGDVFTKITVVVAALWVALAGLSGFALRAGATSRYTNEPPAQPQATAAEQPPTPTVDEESLEPDQQSEAQTDQAGGLSGIEGLLEQSRPEPDSGQEPQ